MTEHTHNWLLKNSTPLIAHRFITLINDIVCNGCSKTEHIFVGQKCNVRLIHKTVLFFFILFFRNKKLVWFITHARLMPATTTEERSMRITQQVNLFHTLNLSFLFLLFFLCISLCCWLKPCVQLTKWENKLNSRLYSVCFLIELWLSTI